MKQNSIFQIVSLMIVCGVLLLIQSCSSTSAIPEGEQLFTGLKKIKYVNYEPGIHADETMLEMESVLASAPTGAFMGSSYYRTPFPIRLWMWNAFANSKGGIGKWLAKSFGSKPKLLSQVNPLLRAQVAQQQLQKFGYFNGKVSFENVTEHNPKQAKIAYTVDMGHLWTLDTVSYKNFPLQTDSLIHSSMQETLLHKGDAFEVATLEAERLRIANLFRNHGYYYYEESDAKYLADTVNTPGKVQLRFQMVDSISERASHPWYIGKIAINFKKQFMESLDSSRSFRNLIINYNGKRPPLRAGVILSGVNLRSRKLYSYEDEDALKQRLQSLGLFSYTNLQFTPRDSSLNCDTLDVNLDLIFDKPYSFYIEGNAKGKTTGRVGPQLVMGLTKQNAFRGGEVLDISANGSYEWQTAHQNENSSSKMNSYEYGAAVSLTMPRLLTPWSLFVGSRKGVRRRRHHYYGVPSTTLKVATNILNRADYFKRHVVSGELTYEWANSETSRHSFTPLSISYQYMNDKTQAFDSLLSLNPYLQISMRDQFVPKMSYTYSYRSPSKYQNPITWSTTISEASNILSGFYVLFGEKWNTTNKTMFKNPYAQFLKLETDFVKQWKVGESSTLVGHFNVGAIWSYGNATQAPYYEQFYVGGANSIRAFNVRSIGPGKYVPADGRFSYIDQTGDIKLLANLEYRPQLFGSLYGAIFLDAGNVWALHSDDARPGSTFALKDFARQIAVGTGIGLRYDIGMFVLRLDWGIGLHVPYQTEKSGFYNVSSFKNAQSIHLAIGYPF